MAFRGRGRGRGRYGAPQAKQDPFELFPEVESLGNAASVTERINLAIWHSKLQKYWNSSPYYLEEESDVLKKTKGMDIQRFSDRTSERAKSKPPLAHFIRMDPTYVPAELAKGGRGEKHAAKRVRWNAESDNKKLDLLEKLDQKSKDEGEKKKDGEDEEEEQEEKIEEEEEEFSDDGDYNQMKPCIEGCLVEWFLLAFGNFLQRRNSLINVIGLLESLAHPKAL
ncbi:uncharacterized protein LOC132064522 isoform X1 [Lycium ferocissimum]|uniref:uncharacterized protein LOC132064522 isoform X1 n=1 Tax=Lycium ferocissimum TaxID=112874 RepID=UPI002814AB74|nr:uncharacterized protein LOC132064522 isoform X1 [Lycium ferocissimum]